MAVHVYATLSRPLASLASLASLAWCVTAGFVQMSSPLSLRSDTFPVSYRYLIPHQIHLYFGGIHACAHNPEAFSKRHRQQPFSLFAQRSIIVVAGFRAGPSILHTSQYLLGYGDKRIRQSHLGGDISSPAETERRERKEYAYEKGGRGEREREREREIRWDPPRISKSPATANERLRAP
ncbi:hypothetical protein F4859DRAFT_82993 [Xylaria cf. heliscus]|nr:hypothetical protein F4859DRAFT_82993 [Xylaria cf. heliscus]